jgi:hypothetical protein
MESAVVAGENPDNLPENSENSENLLENSENPGENPGENSENPPPPKRGGRPPGAKDKVPRAVPRRKVTIVEEPLVSAQQSPQTPSPAKAAAAKAAAKARAPPAPKAPPAEQQVRYVDRFVEHSPRTLMHLAASHAMDAQRSKQDARREHFSNVFTSRLVQLP